MSAATQWLIISVISVISILFLAIFGKAWLAERNILATEVQTRQAKVLYYKGVYSRILRAGLYWMAPILHKLHDVSDLPASEFYCAGRDIYTISLQRVRTNGQRSDPVPTKGGGIEVVFVFDAVVEVDDVKRAIVDTRNLDKEWSGSFETSFINMAEVAGPEFIMQLRGDLLENSKIWNLVIDEKEIVDITAQVEAAVKAVWKGLKTADKKKVPDIAAQVEAAVKAVREDLEAVGLKLLLFKIRDVQPADQDAYNAMQAEKKERWLLRAAKVKRERTELEFGAEFAGKLKALGYTGKFNKTEALQALKMLEAESVYVLDFGNVSRDELIGMLEGGALKTSELSNIMKKLTPGGKS